MDHLSHESLEPLLRPREGPCISLYAPMVRAGQDVRQNPIRWKNLLRTAENRLAEWQGERPDGDLLAPARELLDDDEFWRHQAEGLACLLAADGSWTWRLPVPFEESARVLDGRFALRPLLSLLDLDGRFFVLALSQNDLRLYSGTRLTIEEVPLEDVPRSLAEARWLDDPERSVQHHTSEGDHPGGRPAATFHGQGLPSDFEKKQLRRFLEQVDGGLRSVFAGERAPLVVASVDHVRALWAEVCDYPHLSDSGIAGNPEPWSDEELHDRAWRIVEPVFRRRIEQAVDRYRQFEHEPQTSDDTEAILAAAEQGRVEILLVPPDGGPHEELDAAVIETLSKGGRVHVVDAEELPGEGIAAAVYRY